MFVNFQICNDSHSKILFFEILILILKITKKLWGFIKITEDDLFDIFIFDFFCFFFFIFSKLYEHLKYFIIFEIVKYGFSKL